MTIKNGFLELYDRDTKGRSNWAVSIFFHSMAFLFAGSHQAAEMTAAMYSLMATCKKNGVDEHHWLTDVFEEYNPINIKDPYQLLPNNWIKYRNG